MNNSNENNKLYSQVLTTKPINFKSIPKSKRNYGREQLYRLNM